MSQLNRTTDYITDLYSYKPAYKNLYKIEIFDLESYAADSTEKTLYDNMQNYILLHAYQVDLDGEELTLQRNSVTKQFSLPSKGDVYKLTSNLKINWRESDMWFVRKYHEKWLSNFYIKETDQFVSGPTGKFKNFLITLPSSDDKKQSRILLRKVLPKTAGNLSLQWSQTGGIVTHNLDYYVTSWEWYDPLGQDDAGLLLSEGKTDRTNVENSLRG